MRKYIFSALSDPAEDDRFGNFLFTFILVLIGLNVLSGILETVPSYNAKYKNFFYYFELFSVVIFSVEYVLKLWTCTTKKEFSHPIAGRWKFMKAPMSIVDLLAILPFYLQIFLTGIDLRFIRVLRLFRLFRVFRVGKLAESFQTLFGIISKRTEELFVSLVVVMITVILSANIIYIVEHDAQPEAFSSVPDAMWWSIITVTTIGYGDIYPITPLGRIIGALIGFLGICVFALPVGIIGAGFVEEMEAKRKIEEGEDQCTCPHCGKSFNPD